MIRIQQFRALSEHAWYGRLYARLSADEVSLCETFILTHGALSAGDFEMLVARMWLDKPRPRNAGVISELLTVAGGDTTKEKT